MTIENLDRCEICGLPAVYYFGNNDSLPICANVVCQQAMLDEINKKLQEAAQEGEEQ